MKKIVILIFICFLFSCKSKVVLTQKEVTKIEMLSDKILFNHNANKIEFSNLYIKANAKYKDEKQSQSVTAEIKIKKDEKILVSIRFLGFTMAKALITPTSVQYYEKIGGTFFNGNYETLSKWLGSDLNYTKLQNLFLGKTFDDLSKEKLENISDELFYKLANNDGKIIKTFSFDKSNFLLKKQEVSETAANRLLQIFYSDYQSINQMQLPLSFQIEANSDSKTTSISIDYRNISVNEDLNFPYSVPDDYKQIFIK